MGRPKLSRETKFSGANRDREKNSNFSVQLTTDEIGNHTRLIHTLLKEPAIRYTHTAAECLCLNILKENLCSLDTQ